MGRGTGEVRVHWALLLATRQGRPAEQGACLGCWRGHRSPSTSSGFSLLLLHVRGGQEPMWQGVWRGSASGRGPLLNPPGLLEWTGGQGSTYGG